MSDFWVIYGVVFALPGLLAMTVFAFSLAIDERKSRHEALSAQGDGE